MSDEGPRPKKGETVLKDTFLKWPFAKDFVYDVNRRWESGPCENAYPAVKGNIVLTYG